MLFGARMFILIGIVLLGLAADAEHRGIASVQPPTRLGFLYREQATRAENLKRFREMMAYKWSVAAIFLIVGLIMLGIERRIDRLDPLDPEFGGTDALDDLDRTLDKEERQRHRPFK